MTDWASIAAALSREDIHLDLDSRPTALAGGDISAAWRVATDRGHAFLKHGTRAELDAFTAEAEGLAELADAGAVRVPRPLFAGHVDDGAVLVLEWLELAPPDDAVSRRFGTQLAALHRQSADSFGWHRDNVIGRTPQANAQSGNWITFYREKRLEHQLRLAARKGYTGELQEQGAFVCENIAAFFENYEPVPSLLHGDLWGGNWAASGSEPVMFDPAVYYGDRETDLAMTRLFGGFPRAFYRAYEAAWPLAQGHEQRVALYQLYHVLNHLNLFGRSYLGRALGLLSELADEID